MPFLSMALTLTLVLTAKVVSVLDASLWEHFSLSLWKFLDKKGQYTPKSDASLCINKFPHLVLEVYSSQSQSDRNRMLLQAACLARLGNALRGTRPVRLSFRRYTSTTSCVRHGTSCTSLMCRMLLL
jgi:hypothetical protein